MLLGIKKKLFDGFVKNPSAEFTPAKAGVALHPSVLRRMRKIRLTSQASRALHLELVCPLGYLTKLSNLPN
jgi:hypothetical protein